MDYVNGVFFFLNEHGITRCINNVKEELKHQTAERFKEKNVSHCRQNNNFFIIFIILQLIKT